MKIEKLELTQEDLDKIYNTDQTFWFHSRQVLVSPSFPADTSDEEDFSAECPSSEEVNSQDASICKEEGDVSFVSRCSGECPAPDTNIPLGVEKQDQSYTDCLFPVSPLPPFSSSERKPSTPEGYVVDSVGEWLEIDEVERWYFER